jgi:putative DNA methylase
VTKKLIEVALPLEAINRESAREKSIRHGHPSTLHLWWARRPLASCRAVIFASLVDDPSSHPDKFPTEEAQERERQRLFAIIEELVKWENTTNEKVLGAAREEIRKSTGNNAPMVLDPFCGGGSIPLEVQRLGLRVQASDLNPVAVLITKALIEIPPRFANNAPVNPESRRKLNHSGHWQGAQGLAEDVRYYGKWISAEAERRIGHLFPKVNLPPERGGGIATVIAWIWARTVVCSNPACGGQIPLARTFWLATKLDKKSWIVPVIDKKSKTLNFAVRSGLGEPPAGTMNSHGATCIFCQTALPFDYLRAEGRAGRLGTRLMAIAAEGNRGRLYLAPDPEQELVAGRAHPEGVPDTDLPTQALGFRVQLYGITKHRDLFTPRQLVALTTLSDLVNEMRKIALADAQKAGMSEDGGSLDNGGTGAFAYADAVATYAAFVLDRMMQQYSTLSPWSSNPAHELVVNMFSRQTLSMTWDFGEINPFCDAASWNKCLDFLCKVLENLSAVPPLALSVRQLDAMSQAPYDMSPSLIVTDPPYYDNIGYADLSDFFYIWLRRALGKVFPNLFSTVLVPKAQELVATPFRFDGSRAAAQRFFEDGLRKAFDMMREAQHPDYPLCLFYAFKQVEESEEAGDDGPVSQVSSTGWETMLEALLNARFAIDGTWPVRTERMGRMRSQRSNALASSIVLVCRPRPEGAPPTTRREFLRLLKEELPAALRKLKQGNIAPVDLAQASIGPGMEIFSRYSKVLEADGTPMTVRTALALINQGLDEVLAEMESEFDPGTRWALAWFEQFGMDEASFGVAETLSKAKNTSINGLVETGILASKAGQVRLLKRSELSKDWDPATDHRLTVWEVTQHLIQELDGAGEAGAAELLRKLGSLGEIGRDLAYRLYSICERKKWAQEALSYNGLVIAWPEIARLAKTDKSRQQQAKLNL